MKLNGTSSQAGPRPGPPRRAARRRLRRRGPGPLGQRTRRHPGGQERRHPGRRADRRGRGDRLRVVRHALPLPPDRPARRCPSATAATSSPTSATSAAARRSGNDLALLRDGRIAVSSIFYSPSDVRLQVHTASGALDPAFDGDDGILELDLSGQDRWDAGGFIAGTRDGKIVVAGTHADGSSTPGTLEVVAVPSLHPVADVAVSIGATPNPAPAGPVRVPGAGAQRRADGGTGVAPHVRGVATDRDGAARARARASRWSRTTTTCTFGTIPVGGEADRVGRHVT